MNENAVFKLLPKNPAKISTLGNIAGSNRSKQRDEPIEIPSDIRAEFAQGAGKILRTRCDWFLPPVG